MFTTLSAFVLRLNIAGDIFSLNTGDIFHHIPAFKTEENESRIGMLTPLG